MDSTYLSNLNTYLNNPNFQPTAGAGIMSGFGSGSQPSGFGSNFFGNNPGLGFNSQTLQLALGGLSAIGNFWNAFQSNKLAKDQFNFTKGITEKNLANQTKAYNTTLNDRITSRASVTGASDAEVADYLAKNSL